MAINSNKVDRILEQLNEAMMRASEDAAARKPADLTVLAEIVDDTTIANGYYIVWDGSVRYKAYSEKTNYKKGQKVYVLIPEGDTSKQKQITGIFFSENNNTIIVNNDWDDYYPLYSFVLKRNNFGLIVNGENTKINILEKNNTTNQSALQGRKYLGVSFDYSSNLGYNINRDSGYFVLKINIHYTASTNGTLRENPTYTKTYEISSRDILGDPFNYLSWHNIKSLIELVPEDNADKISSITASFEQTGTLLTATNEIYPIANKPNVNLKNIKITFGNNKWNLGDELFISTLQGLDYDSAQESNYNQKIIDLRWTHSGIKDNEHFMAEIKEKDNPGDYEISSRIVKWYKDTNKTIRQRNEEIGWETAQVRSLGKIWEKAKNIINTSDMTDDLWELLINSFRLIEKRHYIDADGVKTLLASGQTHIENTLQSIDNDNEELLDSSTAENKLPESITDNDNKSFSLLFDPDVNRTECSVWAEMIITFINGDEKTVKSNILTFKNKQKVPDEGTMIATSVEVSLLDGSDGEYSIYDEGSGKIISDIYNRDRRMVVDCFDESGINCLNGSEVIVWAFPKNQTMIYINNDFIAEDDGALFTSADKEYKSFNEIYGIYNDKYTYIVRRGQVETTQISTNDDTQILYKRIPASKFQKYRVETQYNKDYRNNIVKCYVLKNKVWSEGSIELFFNQYIVPTSAYKLQLNLGDVYKYKNGKFEYYASSNGAIKKSKNIRSTIDSIKNNECWTEVEISLFDEYNNEIKLTNAQKNDIIKIWLKSNEGYLKEGYYSGYYTQNDSSYWPWNKDGRFFIHINERNPQAFKYLALKGRASVWFDFNEDGNLEFDEKRFCYSVLPIQTKVCHYLINDTTLDNDINKLQRIATLLGTNYISGSPLQIPVETEIKPIKIVINSNTNKASIAEKNETIKAPIAISDIEKLVFDRLRLENKFGIIQYDEKNANPKYAKDKIELKYLEEIADNDISYLDESIQDSDEIMRRYIWEYNELIDKTSAGAKEKLKIAQYFVDDINNSYYEKAKAEVNKAIAKQISKNGKTVIKLIWPTKTSDIADEEGLEWMPSISSTGRLKVPSAYMEHNIDNDLALEVSLCLKNDTDGTNPFITFYQPIVILSSKDNIPIIDEDWEGKEIKTEPRKTTNSTVGNNAAIVNYTPTRALENTTPTYIGKSSLSYLKQEMSNNNLVASGLVMGEIQSQYPWTNPTEPTKYINALAGYKNGVQMFELNNDGNLYLGTPPSANNQGGGLRFDGDGAFIEGGYSYDEENGFVPGMTINFNTGAITSNKNIDLVYSSSNDGHFSVSDGTTNNRIYLNNRGFNLTTAGDVNIKSGNLKINSGSVTVGSSSNFSVSSSNVAIDLEDGGTFRVSNDDSWITLDSSNFNIYTKKGSIDLIYGQNAHFMAANNESWSNATSGIYMHRLNNKDRIDIKSNGDIDLTGATVTLQNTNDTGHLILTENGGIDLKANDLNMATGGNFTLTAGNNSSITFNNGFSVNSSGAITATSGTIAGWKIVSNYLMSPIVNNCTAAIAPRGTLIKQGGLSTNAPDMIAFLAGNLSHSFVGSGDNRTLGNSDYIILQDEPEFYVTYDGSVHGQLVTEVSNISNNMPNYVLRTDLDTLVGNAGYAKTADLNISNWNTAYSMRHSHSNKTLLDGIDATVLVNKAKMKTILAKINELVTEFNTLTGLSMNTLSDNWDTLQETN